MPNRFLKLILGIVLVAISFQTSFAQKEKFHSVFIYNFSKYVKWPESKNSEKFVIGMLGKSPIEEELEVMSKTKKVNGTPIEIKQFNSVDEISDCHILYISASASNSLGKVISQIENKPVLIVTDNPGSAYKGATINFINQNGKIRFELNQQNAESKGLKVAGSLANLAILV